MTVTCPVTSVWNPNEYEALLIVAGLASYTRFGIQIKADAWRNFLGGRRFVADDCPIEFEQKKFDLDAYINGTPPSRLQRRTFYVAVAVAVTSKATAAAMAAVAAAAEGAVTATTMTTMTRITTTTMAVAAAAAMTTAAATHRQWLAHATIN
jgi:hypothetical protein